MNYFLDFASPLDNICNHLSYVTFNSHKIYHVQALVAPCFILAGI
jgi:hypothetical protein